MKRLLLMSLMFLGVTAPLWSIERVAGNCEQGGTQVNVPSAGGQSTDNSGNPTNWQQSFASCTVTVYVSGTLTLATIYTDNNVPPNSKGNPFTAATDGYWFFYAPAGRYDVTFSGGIHSISPPFSRGDFVTCDPVGPNPDYCQGGNGTTIGFTATPVFNATAFDTFLMTLTGNVTSSTITGGSTWQEIHFSICQNGTGGYVFNWPANLLYAPNVTLTPSECTQVAAFNNGTNWVAIPNAPGSDTQVSFNNAGSAFGASGLTYNVATGDTTTSILNNTCVITSTAIDAGTSFNTCLTALSGFGGGRIHFGPGLFVETVTPNKVVNQHIWVDGDGPSATTVKVQVGANNDGFQFACPNSGSIAPAESDAPACGMSNMTLYGNTSNSGVNLVEVNDTLGFQMENIQLWGSNGTGARCLYMNNVPVASNQLNNFSERLHIGGGVFIGGNCKYGIDFENNTGGVSFDHTDINGLHLTNGAVTAPIGINVGANVNSLAGYLNAQFNMATGTMISATGNFMMAGVIDAEGGATCFATTTGTNILAFVGSVECDPFSVSITSGSIFNVQGPGNLYAVNRATWGAGAIQIPDPQGGTEATYITGCNAFQALFPPTICYAAAGQADGNGSAEADIIINGYNPSHPNYTRFAIRRITTNAYDANPIAEIDSNGTGIFTGGIGLTDASGDCRDTMPSGGYCLHVYAVTPGSVGFTCNSGTNGDEWINTAGGVGTTKYICRGGTWVSEF